MPDAVEELGMCLDQPPGAEDSPRLLVRQRREHEVARRSTALLGADQGGDHHRDAALHVEGPAAPQVAIDDVAAERPLPPVLIDGGDDVDVPLQQQRGRLPAALHSRDQVGTARSTFVSSAFDARVPQHPLDELDGHVLLARRVGGVEANEVAGELDDKRERLHAATRLTDRDFF